MHTLHDLLWNSTLEVLTFRLKLLKTKPTSAKKADCIDAIKHCYVARDLEVIWASLGETAGLVCSQKELLNLCFPIGASGVVVPAGHETKFRKVIHDLGFGIV